MWVVVRGKWSFKVPLGSDFIALAYLEYTLSCNQINFIIKTYEGQMVVAQKLTKNMAHLKLPISNCFTT